MLFREIDVFIELNNFILYTDYYVIRFLLDYLDVYGEMYDGLGYIEDKLVDIYGGKIEEEVDILLADKLHINPLVDLVDYTKTPEDFHIGILDGVYNEVFKTIDYNSNRHLRPSSMVQSLITMVKLKQCNEMCIYSDSDIPDFVEVKVATMFNSTKVKFIFGDLKTILQTHHFDSYFINSVDMVRYIPKRDKLIDIIIPLYRHNISFNGEKEVLDTYISYEELIEDKRQSVLGAKIPL